MKTRVLSLLLLLSLTGSLVGCDTVGEKATKYSIIYGVTAALSLLLLVGCCLLARKTKGWFVLLFASVAVVNLGYTLLSVSGGLTTALWANRLAYLGSVLLPFAMLQILLSVTGMRAPRWLIPCLGGLAAAIFLVAASPGILPIYYKEVSFAVVNGASTLVKVYGPLHPLYLLYLVGYFAAMVAVIIRAIVKKTVDSPSHAVILAIAVFVNLGVWLIEQMSDMTFEFLSVSYLISELFLLGLHLAINEQQRLLTLAEEKASAPTAPEPVAREDGITSEAIAYFEHGLLTLTPTERAVYEAYRRGISTKEIMADLNIKENTLKFHNKNLYGKLGVSSRKQLLAVDAAREDAAS